MNRIIILAFVVFGAVALAQIDEQAKPALNLNWSVDFAHVKDWLYTDQANVQRLMDWMDANLTQKNLDSFETLVFSATDEQKKAALQDVREKLIRAGLKESNPDDKAVLDAIQAATAEK